MLKPNIEILYENSHELIINNTITRQYYVLEADNKIKFFFQLIDGNNSVTTIKERMQTEFKQNLDEDIDIFLNLLMDKNTLSFAPINISEGNTRYIDQINFLSNFSKEVNGDALQNLIKKRKICVLGLGGTGNHIARGLCASGIENLIINDPDYIVTKNLPRQTLYLEKDVGFYKVDIAEKRLKMLNSEINLVCHKKRIAHEEDLEEIIPDDVDLVINCMDEPSMDFTSVIVNNYCQKNSIPFLTGGGYNAHYTALGYLIIPNKTFCVPCLLKALETSCNEIKVFKEVNTKLNYGTLGCIANLTADLQLLEIFKFLTGFSEPLIIDTYTIFDFVKLEIKKVNLADKVDFSCEKCGHLKMDMLINSL